MKILLEIYEILKNIKYIKRNTIAFHEYYNLYKILMKIKNVAVAFLVLLVFETTSKKKSSYMNNFVVVTSLEHEKSYKTPHTYNLVVITPLEHENILARKKNWSEKKFGAKKIKNFLIEVNDTKNFLDPSGDNPSFIICGKKEVI